MKKFTIKVLTLGLFILLSNSIANAQRIAVTVAGTGTVGYSGDGASGRNAQVSGPRDVCMDAAQNIYFTEMANGRVRMVSANSEKISTIAGGGTSLADGVPATTALITPKYMCIDPSGNIYITTDNEIRKINLASGIITTVAGSATAGYTGDGYAATLATLNNPEGICIDDAGNIYFVDRGNNAIRKIAVGTGIITTITSAGLSGPVCICISPSGDIYFSDQNPNFPNYDNSVIKKIAAGTGVISTIAGTGTLTAPYGLLAIDAVMGTTTGLYFDRTSGNVYCCEMSCSCRKLDFSTDTLYQVAGNFYAQGFTDDIASCSANMNIPYGLCMDNMGTIYVADSNNQRIRKLIQLTHTPTFAFGKAQYMDPAIGTPNSLDSLLWITDVDSAQTEIWTVLSAPMYGTLSGFPTSAPSNSIYTTTKPSGLMYTTSSGYTGGDLFRIRISDGDFSDTITVYVGANSEALAVNTTKAVAPEVNIFPNPASSMLSIEWKNLATGASDMVITDIADRVFYTSALTGNNKTGSMQIDISSFPAGVYIVRMNGSEIRKFVKQ